MNFSLDLFSLASLMAIVQGQLLTMALLYTNRGKRLANQLLAAFLFTLSLFLLIILIHHSTDLFQFVHLIRVEAPFVFTFGPFLFLYVRLLVTERPHIGWKSLFHFAPFVLYATLLVPFYLQSELEKINYCLTFLQGRPLEWHLDTTLGLIHFMIYVALAVRVYRQSRLLNGTSGRRLITHRPWMRNLIIGFGSVWMAAVVYYSSDSSIFSHLPYVLIAGIVFYTGFKGLTQPEIFNGGGRNGTDKKYSGSTLTPERSEEILTRLQSCMQEKKPFKDSHLNLPGLAKRLSVSSHHLSQIINEQLNQNFFEYVNSRRIEEAQRMLLDPDNKNSNLSEIALAVGFNSISAFNTAFKKHTQLTPSQFRNSLAHD